jgi:enediyne biosynthesis protein E4
MNGILRFTIMGVLLAGGSLALRSGGSSAVPSHLRFEECAATAGLHHVHTMCHLSEKLGNIMPWLTSVGAAVAAADVDGDGLVDLYVTSSGHGDSNRLFRNKGDGTFEDITERAGVGVGNPAGASMAAVFGDMDNDGDQDLYVVMWGAPNRLFENLGNGTFRDITEESGTGYWGYGNGATWIDYDRDGLPDLFVGNYFPEAVPDPATGKMRRLDLWDPFTTRVMHESFTRARNGGRNVMYHNLGHNRFEDVTDKLGLGYTGWTLAVGAADLDNDGWPDLYVANDFGADELYYNTGATEWPPRFLPFIGREGHPAIGDDWWKGMNVDFGDVDGNGFLDIYVTNILAPRYKTDEGNMLWLNLPDPKAPHGRKFVNVGKKTGTHDGGWGWGAKFGDFNNDGLLDILEANGFVTGPDPGTTYWYDLQEMVTQLKNATADAADWPVMGNRDLSGYERNRLWIQRPSENGELRFTEVAEEAGVRDLYNGRGVALLDADNDGDLDFYIANQGKEGTFYRNLLYGPGGRDSSHWLGLDLAGAPESVVDRDGRRLASSADADGARAVVSCDGKAQRRDVQGGTGFAAQSDRRLFFGLGGCAVPESIELFWPSGRMQRIDAAAARAMVDRMNRIEEKAIVASAR